MAQTPCCIQHVCLQPPGVHLGSEEVLAAGSSPAFALNAAPGAGGAAQAPPGQSKVGVHAGALCIYWVHMHVVVKGELLPGADGAGGEEGDAGQAFVQVLNEDVVDLQVGVALRGWGGVRWSPLPLKLG